ncbi:MAG TPA: hypothetical protein VFY26_00635 [Anaerolineales bacterium]|nr:hypothetical protein [Anaerolineales bacterium]
MQNRTLGIVLTAVSAFICGCAGLFSCIWGGLIATGTPIDVTSNGITAPQTFSPTIGYALVCLSLLFLLVPLAVGFFTLRKRDPAM